MTKQNKITQEKKVSDAYTHCNNNGMTQKMPPRLTNSETTSFSSICKYKNPVKTCVCISKCMDNIWFSIILALTKNLFVLEHTSAP